MSTDDGTARPITDEELHALVDGRLPPTVAAELEVRVAADPRAQATLHAWRVQREELRRLHRQLLDEPVPRQHLDAALRIEERLRHRVQWWQLGGMAASVVLACGAGWFAHGMSPGAGSAQRQFAREAAVAYVAFQPEVRHPVEVTADQNEHLIQWLTKRLGRPLKVPQLSAQGWELMGGRLLPGEQGPRAQFMFQDAGGQRVTLYIGAVDKDRPASQETAFSFSGDERMPGFYWVDRGFGYAITGKLPRQALLELATSVHRQLSI
jgi:anti-sigma factor RsiW